MVVIVVCSSGCCHRMHTSQLKISASGVLYGAVGYHIFAVAEVLSYESIN